MSIFDEVLHKEEVVDRLLSQFGCGEVEKGRKADIGEIHNWNGVKVQKTAQGWKVIGGQVANIAEDVRNFQNLTASQQVSFYEDYLSRALIVYKKLGKARKEKDKTKIVHYESKYKHMQEKLDALKPYYDKAKAGSGKTGGSATADQFFEVKSGDTFTIKQMQEVFDKYNTKPELVELGKKVFAIADEIGIPVRVRKIRGNAIGLYHWDGYIEYDISIFDKKQSSPKLLINTILHEAIHACTCHYLNHDNYLNPKCPTAIKEACEELVSLYKASKSQLNDMYGATNVMEFVAELSNPKFRKQLKLAQIWHRVVASLAKLFYGREVKGTVKVDGLERATKALDTLLENVDTDFLVSRHAKWYDRMGGSTKHFYPKPHK